MLEDKSCREVIEYFYLGNDEAYILLCISVYIHWKKIWSLILGVVFTVYGKTNRNYLETETD